MALSTTQWVLIGAGAYFLLNKPAAVAPAPAGSTPAPTNGGSSSIDPSQQLLDYGNTLISSLGGVSGIGNSIGGLF